MGINKTVAEDLKTMILIPKSERNKAFMHNITLYVSI